MPDPTDDIEAYALNASGVVNIIVFDPKGWALFRSFKAVKEKLDTRRGSNSELETAVKDLGKAVSYTWQAELHIEVFLPAQVPDSELDSWMESRIYPVMSDIPALSDLLTSMVASGYDYALFRADVHRTQPVFQRSGYASAGFQSAEPARG